MHGREKESIIIADFSKRFIVTQKRLSHLQ